MAISARLGDQSGAAFQVIEALCQHHSVVEFESVDEPEYAQWLEIYSDRANRAYGDRVLVAVNGRQVRGFLASIDVTLVEPAEFQGSYFFVSAVAVSDEYRGSSILTALARAALDTVEPIEAIRANQYRGVLAQPGANRSLQAALRALGFRPVPGTDFWAKRR